MFNKQKVMAILKKYLKKIQAKKRLKIMLLIGVFVLLAILFFDLVVYKNRIYPNIYIADINVGKLKKDQAVQTIKSGISIPNAISISGNDQSFTLPLKEVDFSINYEESVNLAYHLHRNNNIFLKVKGKLFSRLVIYNIPLVIDINKSKLSESLSVISEQISLEPTIPSITIDNDKVIINRGLKGNNVDQKLLYESILNKLVKADFSSINVPVYTIDPTLSEYEEFFIQKKAESLLDKTATLLFEDNKFVFDDGVLVSFLGLKQDFNEDNIISEINNVSKKIDRNHQNPIFVFEQDKVIEFTPSKDGVKVDKDALNQKIKESLSKLLTTDNNNIVIDIPVSSFSPDYQTSDINNLGIQKRIGKGTSYFRGSIPSRVHNITLASGHFNGVLVKPNETLSFNQTVGDVSKLTGYKEAYIIKDGKTVLGDGGGLCQVSTTLFRASLNAGLPIVERRAHSYRVTYYEQESSPGIDATVYSPTTDLKILNDTSAHLLIQTFVDTKTSMLSFEIYGTDDGRISEISKPIVYDVTPPPEDLYIEDPAIPNGVVKQVDWKAWGAKVKFDYTVVRDNNIIFEKSFFSNYRPWQSVYIKGTAPI